MVISFFYSFFKSMQIYMIEKINRSFKDGKKMGFWNSLGPKIAGFELRNVLK